MNKEQKRIGRARAAPASAPRKDDDSTERSEEQGGARSRAEPRGAFGEHGEHGEDEPLARSEHGSNLEVEGSTSPFPSVNECVKKSSARPVHAEPAQRPGEERP